MFMYYNYLNKITKIDYSSSPDIEYGYAFFGNLVSREIGTETTHYIYDGAGRMEIVAHVENRSLLFA